MDIYDEYTKGLYSINVHVNSSGESGNGMPAQLVSNDKSGLVKIPHESILSLEIDNLYQEKLMICKGSYSFLGIVTLLNSLAKHVTFSCSKDSLSVVTKSVGVAASIKVLISRSNNANSMLAFPLSSKNNSTAVPVSISIATKTPTGHPAGNREVLLGLWRDCDGRCNDAAFQRVSVGTGDPAYSNILSATTGKNGFFACEIAKAKPGEIYLHASGPRGYSYTKEPDRQPLLFV